MLWILLIQTLLLPMEPPEAWTAVFRHLIEQQTFPGAEYLCLGVVVPEGEEWEIRDPPSEVIDAFADLDRPVGPATKCRMSRDGNVHLESGASAQFYLIESSRISGLSGEVSAKYQFKPLLGGSVFCAVLKGPATWEAICRHVGLY